MRLTEVSYGSARAIEGYGPGFFRVSGHVLRGACLITPWDAGPGAGCPTPQCRCRWREDRRVARGHGGRDRAPARSVPPGTGGRGIGVEVMNSPAACRTYNVLLGEGRRIAVALLPVG